MYVGIELHKKEEKMKKIILLPIIGLMLMAAAAAIPVQAATVLYVQYNNTKVYRERNRESEVIQYLNAGEKVLIDHFSTNEQWAGILVEDPQGDGQMMGWIYTKNLDQYMPSSKCSHEWTAWFTVVEPTCTEKGIRARSCPICSAYVQDEIDKLPHSFGNWKVTKEATCTSEGRRERRCSVCGFSEEQTIEKLAHEYGSWKVTKEATCTSEGSRVRKCSVCGHEDTQTLEKLPHSYGEWTVTKEPTCTAEGQRVHTCKVCGYKGEEAIAKLPHNFRWEIITEATDHSSGVRNNVCQDCGYTEEKVSFDPEGTLRRGDRSEAVRDMQQLLADQNYLNADGADGIFGSGTERAVMEFQNSQGLTADGVAWPQTLQKLKHDFGPWNVTKTLTRTQAGERTRTCKECNYEQHEVIELVPSMEKGSRGEDVRAAQQMLSALGYDTGSYDGIYGKKFDAAYEEFAKENNVDFEAGKVDPSGIDILVNSWIASVPEAEWMGEGGLDAPVKLALTVTPSEDDDENLVTYNWSLTNMGDEECIFTALLLHFGEEDFTKDNFVMVLDGTGMKANCGNSVSGSFVVNREWGDGNISFAALGVDEDTGAKWLSNTEVYGIAAIEEADISAESAAEPAA